MNRANCCWLGTFLWLCLVAYMIPKITEGQIFWLFLASVVAVIYTAIITTQTYESGGKL